MVDYTRVLGGVTEIDDEGGDCVCYDGVDAEWV